MKFLERRARPAEARLAPILADHEPPTFPQVTLRILAKLRDQECSTDEVSETLQWDPGLVVRLLRVVNSAA